MIQAQTESEFAPAGKPLKGWHVLLIMLGFFGVVFAVNGVFLYHAITSFPGEDVKKSYVQGLGYNNILAERAAQAELGWQAEAGFQDGDMIVRLQDADNLPISNMLVVGDLRRLATSQEDRAIAFTPGLDGEYTTSVGALASGQWLLRVNVFDTEGEQVVFHVEKTLLVP